MGELVAVRYLQTHGYSIICQNYRKKCGEIDIIAEKGERLHFVEVKSIQEGSNYPIQQNVSTRKLQRITRTLGVFLTEHGQFDSNYQIDVITVRISLNTHRAYVAYIENIVE